LSQKIRKFCFDNSENKQPGPGEFATKKFCGH